MLYNVLSRIVVTNPKLVIPVPQTFMCFVNRCVIGNQTPFQRDASHHRQTGRDTITKGLLAELGRVQTINY